MSNVEQEMEIDLRELIGIIWRRKWIIILFFLFAVVASYFISGQMTRIYETSTLVLVQEEGGMEELFADRFSPYGPGTNLVATYTEMLRSRHILDQVIERMELVDEEGEPLTARSLRNNISIRKEGDTNLITITATYSDPEIARDLANTVVEVFREENERMNRAQLRAAAEFIDEQLIVTEARLGEQEDRLLEFKTNEGVAFPREQAQATLDTLLELEKDRAQHQIQREFTQASLSELRNQISAQDEEIVSSRTISQNPQVRELQSRLSDLEIELTGLRETFTDEYPKVKEVLSQKKEIEGRLENAVTEVTSSRTESQNPVFRSLEEEIIRLETELLAGSARLEALDYHIERISGELQTLPQKEMELVRLERDTKVSENLYLMLMERKSEIQIQEAMQQADIEVVDPAVSDDRPIRPRTRLNMALAGVLAIFAGLGLIFLLEFLDTTVKIDRDVEKITGLPVLGVIPDTDREEKPRRVRRGKEEDA